MSSPIIISSKAAQKDLLKIKDVHADLVNGMANQQVRVAGYRMQKAAEMQSQQIVKNEMDKEKMTANTESQKMALDFQTKQSELDIKRASLA